MTEITNAIIEFFQNSLNNDILTTIIIALFPIIELRGAIPVARKLGMDWFSAYFFSWLGSSLVVPFLLLLLMPLLRAMKKWKGFRHLANAVESVFEGKASKIKTKADKEESKRKALFKKMLGVFAFVAVPLPLTGVWTGSAVAVFLGLKFWQALPVVLLGNLTAGAIMTLLIVCFEDHVDMILNIFLIIVVVIVVFYIIMLIIKMVKNKKKNNSVDSVENAEIIEDTEVETTSENTNLLEDNQDVDDSTNSTPSEENELKDDDKDVISTSDIDTKDEQ